MDILNYFYSEMNRTFTLYPKKSGVTGTRPNEGFEKTANLTDVRCAFYTGSAAEILTADRLKTVLSGVVITATGVTIPDGAKLVLDDGEIHYVIHADNPLNMNEVFVVTLQRAV